MEDKSVCKYLKEIREKVANQYNISGFEYEPCDWEDCCVKPCPDCEQKAVELIKLLNEKHVDLSTLKDICGYQTMSNKNSTDTSWENETKLEKLRDKKLKRRKKHYKRADTGMLTWESFYAMQQKELKSLKRRPQFIRKLFTVGQLLGISRIRIDTDGPGIVTLVGLYKCPLNCAYCINHPLATYVEYTIKELYNEVKVDSLYFEATGGGICFGGHEPLLQQKFIKKFIKLVRKNGHNWKFGMETSLNSQLDEELLKMLDFIIVDIKTINPEIYHQYTKGNNEIVLKNLEFIKDKIPNIKIRIPIIPEYNDEQDVENTIEYLNNLGYNENQFDLFVYKTDIKNNWR